LTSRRHYEYAPGDCDQTEDQEWLRLEDVLAEGNLNSIKHLRKYDDEKNTVE